MLAWLWNLLRPRWTPLFPAKPSRWGGRVSKKRPPVCWQLTQVVRPSGPIYVQENMAGREDLMWYWPSDDIIAGLSRPYNDYFGKPPHQGSRKIT